MLDIFSDMLEGVVEGNVACDGAHHGPDGLRQGGGGGPDESLRDHREAEGQTTQPGRYPSPPAYTITQ